MRGKRASDPGRPSLGTERRVLGADQGVTPGVAGAHGALTGYSGSEAAARWAAW
jgi:hypothetical protein